MDGKALYFNASQDADGSSIWKVKGIGGGKRRKQADKGFSVTEFIKQNGRKVEEGVVGPGAGFGAGCGAGFGLGMVGGVGVGGSMWNHLKVVFGIGFGCGVGVGVGYGLGIGVGATLESLRTQFFRPKNESKKPFLIQI